MHHRGGKQACGLGIVIVGTWHIGPRLLHLARGVEVARDSTQLSICEKTAQVSACPACTCKGTSQPAGSYDSNLRCH